MLDLEALSWPAILGLFAGAAALVWWAGMRLPAYAAAIATRANIGQAFAGMLLLGSITTLPELATAGSAAAIGAGELAVNNAFGSIAFNLVLLAIGDAVSGRRALTSIIAKPATLLQGVLGMLLLAIAATAASAASPEMSFLGAGLWTWTLFASTMAALWIASGFERRSSWSATANLPEAEPADVAELGFDLRKLLLHTAGLAALILIGGSLLAEVGDEISARQDIHAGLIGFLLLALATSLPELSTVSGAMRRRRYELAFGDIFGATLFNVAILFVVDMIYAGPPVMTLARPFEAVAALLGLLLTGFFVLGLLERRDRTVWRLGYDSLAVICVYLLGVIYLTALATE